MYMYVFIVFDPSIYENTNGFLFSRNILFTDHLFFEIGMIYFLS